MPPALYRVLMPFHRESGTMPTWLFFLLAALACSVACIFGVLMAVAPRTARRLLAWWARADEWSGPRPLATARGWELDTRVAGVGLTAMGLLLMRVCLRGMLMAPKGAARPVEPVRPTIEIWGSWSAPVPGLLLILSGLWALLADSGLIARWLSWAWPERIIPPERIRLQVRVVRVIGFLLILCGASTIWVLLNHR